MIIRRVLCVGIILFGLSCLHGCGSKSESEDAKKADEIQVESSPARYTFRDVEGNEYEAELLDLPLFSKDPEQFVEQDRKKYYLDEQGTRNSRFGIDVSEYQPEVDWQQVKEFGADYVIVRLGYRGYGEKGTLVEDAMFRTHVENARAAGLDVGVYFFSQAITKEEAKEEAAFVLDRIRDYEITAPVIYDTEEIKFDKARTDALSGAQVTDHCIAFCDVIKEAGYKPMIYANMKWMAYTLDLTRLTEYEMWYADYEPLPQCPYEISMWQYSESGQVPGIPGNVDLNLWFL